MKTRMTAALLAALLLAGCAAQPGASAAQPSESVDPLTLTFFNIDGVSDPWTDPVALKITEATGVSLKTEYPARGSGDAIDLMLADGDYPDLIYAKEKSNRLIEAGALIDLAPLIDEYGPNIKKLYGNDYDKMRWSADEPSIYMLSAACANQETYATSGTAQLQWAVLKENDYAIPRTIDEYETMLKDYLAKYPLINGQQAIGLSICVTDWHWYITLSNPAAGIANGSPDDGQWTISEDGTAHYANGSEGQAKFFRWLNRMYHEGVLDPEFAIQTHDDYLQKIASGRVLGLMDAEWDYADSKKALLLAGQADRTYAGLPVTLNEDVPCTVMQGQGIATAWGVGITTACKDPVRAIKFLDYLCSDEGQVLINWGIEGVNYTLDADGRRVRSAEEVARAESDVNYTAETGVGFHTYPFPRYARGVLDDTGSSYQLQDKQSAIAEYNSEEQAACKAWGVELLCDIFPQADTFPPASHSAGWAVPIPTALSTEKDALDAIAWPGLVDCIICEEADFDAHWQKLQDDLDAAGRAAAEAAMTKAVQGQMAFWKSLG